MKNLKNLFFLLFTSIILLSCEPEEIPAEPLKLNQIVSDTGGTQEKPIDDKKGE